MDPKSKFYCPTCRKDVEVKRAMCVTCGALIACTAISHCQSKPFHGCGDNGILVDEILKLSREKNNLLAALLQVVRFPVSPDITHDFRIERAFNETKQIAKNALKDHNIDHLL